MAKDAAAKDAKCTELGPVSIPLVVKSYGACVHLDLHLALLCLSPWQPLNIMQG